MGEYETEVTVSGVDSRVNKAFSRSTLRDVLEFGQGGDGGHFCSENSIVAWERQPRVDKMVADLPIVCRATTAIKNHDLKALGALLQRLWPPFPYPLSPLRYDLLAESSSLCRGHRAWFRFQVEVRFARTILSDDFIEASGWGPTYPKQDLTGKVDCV